jgi:hypothetical protein
VTIRRVTILSAFLAFGAAAAFGQYVEWSGATSPSAPLPPSSPSCVLPAGGTGDTCVTFGSPYSVQLVVVNPPAGTPVWTYSGVLPQGLNFTSPSSGLISGTPTQPGVYTFIPIATYSGTPVTPANNQPYTIATGSGAPIISPNGLPSNAVAGTSVGASWYTAAVNTSNQGYPFINSSGTPYYQWSFVGASNIDGLVIGSTTGVISGTPLSAGTFNLTIQATDALGQTASFQTVLVVAAASGFVVTTTSLPNGSTGTAYSQTLTSTGGCSSGVAWTQTAGSLPPGLSLSSGGVIAGTPTTVGTYSFSVQANCNPGTGTITSNVQALSISITLSSTLTLPTPASQTVTVGQSVTMQFTATGGSPAYTYTLVSGTFPPGLSLNGATGTLSGTIASGAQGTYTFTVQVKDTSNNTATAQTSITVTIPLTMATPTAVTGVTGQTVTMQFTAAGGVSPYTYTLLSVLLGGNSITVPSTMSLSTTGLLSFQTTSTTPTGVYLVTVQASDSASHVVTTSGTITISAALSMASPAAVTGTVGQTVSMQFTATGGTPPYTYSFVQGTLPPGLTLNPSSGLISGTPTTPGTYGFAIQVTDSASLQATATGTITLNYLTLSGVSISFPGSGGTIPAATQPAVTLTIPSALQQTISGTLAVSFVRTFDSAYSREVNFTNGAPIANFTIPAGQTQASFGSALALIVGTAKGSGTITASFKDSLGNNITPATLQPVIFSVAGQAPVIGGTTCTGCGVTVSAPSNNSYTVTIIGYSTTLDMTNATFSFTPTTGTALASSTLTVSLGSVFTAWYSSSVSNQYGGQFMLTIPLNFSISGQSGGPGTSNPIAALTVTLTNSQGSVTSSTINPQ